MTATAPVAAPDRATDSPADRVAEADAAVPRPVLTPTQSMRVSATIASDDEEVRGTFNANVWFAVAADDQIRELAAVGWADRPADEVAYYFERSSGAVERVFEHVLTVPMSFDRPNDPIIGFEVKINRREAMLWLRENRYPLWLELYHRAQGTA